jgi:putative tricarboxylic transport membrane protein
MLSALSMLGMGFAQLMDPFIWLMCLLGCLMGTLVGVLPGFGTAAAVAVLLPIVYGKDPLTSLVMLAGILAGAMFGGTITSVALNVPGEGASVVTTFDGYQMTKQGRGGVAMGIAAIGSFIGGTIGLALLTIAGTPLASAALAFGPPEYFALYMFTFVAILTLGGGNSFLKSAVSLFLGLLVSTIGIDGMTGTPRLTFGTITLQAGIDFIPAVVGLFGLSEIILSLTDRDTVILKKGDAKFKLKDIFPTMAEFIDCLPTIVRSSFLGFFCGVLPGVGATISTFVTYSVEKRLAKDRDTFGKGNIKGVAAPETANNACASGHYVPLLALGIPSSATSAVLLSAFVLLGIDPGPRLFSEHPQLVWGLIASMYIGNVILLIMNTLFIPFFIWLLRLCQNTMPFIVATLCLIGTYSVNYSVADIFVMLAFTGIGVLLKKLDIPVAPMVIAVILGNDLEFAFRQTLQYEQGSFYLSFMRPLTVVLYICSLVMLLMQARKSYKTYKSGKSVTQ